MTNKQIIWNFLISQKLTEAGAAGLMGNLMAESGLNPKNLQDTYNSSLGLSDESYTNKVDNGSYSNFIYDCAGYGLAQWTWYTRKQKLLKYSKQKNKSIGDIDLQLEFLILELKELFPNLLRILQSTSSVQEASNKVLLNFEQPQDQSVAVQNKRYSYSLSIYNEMKGAATTMAIKTYTKRSNTKLSEHFNSTEFDCQGSGCCSQTLIDDKLVEYLEKIRQHFNAPITITSGYRCPSHNAAVGGASGSRHTKGQAADISVFGHAPKEVAQFAESIGILGIGLYETSKDGHFVHIDTRDYKSYWYGQAQSPRTTFGGSSSASSSSSTTSSVKSLSIGSKGSAVTELQKNLTTLGYNCCGIDGCFGAGTAAAVRAFQAANGLTVDGYAGPLTLQKIKELISSDSSNTEIMEVTATLLNVRSDASLTSSIVNRISKGTKCTVLEKKNNFAKIENPAGWVCLDYLK